MPRSRSRSGASAPVPSLAIEDPISPQRRGVLAGVSLGATSLLLGCGSDPRPAPPPPPNPALGKGGAPGAPPAGTGGAAPSPTAGTGGMGGPPAGSGGTNGSGGMAPGTGGTSGTGGTRTDAMASNDGALNVPDGARIEVGPPAGMPDGATMACDETEDDQLGPYHLGGHLVREVTAGANDGMPLVVTGRVLGTKCEPLANAEVDVWSANGRGVYSEVANGWCRGKVRCDAGGAYKFQIVYPGPYQGRPRHLHLIIKQPGYRSLTTQMYFKGERPDIPSNAVARTMVNGVWQSEWNIVLRSSARAESPVEQPFEPRKLHRRFWAGWSVRPTRAG